MPETKDYGIVPSYKPEEYVWLRNRLSLDLLSIDDEIIEMPTLIQRAGEMTSSAIELREAAKEDLDTVTAQVAEHLRNTPDQKGKQRSETAIASALPLSQNIQGKKSELGQARLDASLWSALTESLRRKDSAIRVTADLLNSGFLTTTSILDKRRGEIRRAK